MDGMNGQRGAKINAFHSVMILSCVLLDIGGAVGKKRRASACAAGNTIIDHFKPCVTDVYLHIDARMADYIHTHP